MTEWTTARIRTETMKKLYKIRKYKQTTDQLIQQLIRDHEQLHGEIK